jgi:DNA topoisomerase-1
LVIVESPTKAKTISKFLPRGLYRVHASVGHIRDIPDGKEIPAENRKPPFRHGINRDTFEPVYVIPADKKAVVKKLKDELKGADEVYIATDEDREGESIGWHLLEVLRKDIKPGTPVKRMVFHEITKDAIEDALRHTRDINLALVEAQETRRMLDRIVGYELSPVLWRKIGPKLSAGRVQSVAVKLLVERERARLDFTSAEYWDLAARLTKSGAAFDAVLTHVGGVRVATGRDFDDLTGKLKTREVVLVGADQARDLAARALGAPWRVADVEEKTTRRHPAAPFTTSTLQQEAGRKLGWPARQTMRTAQSLYEQGYITYMRTDSTTLSREAIEASRRAVNQRYGPDYLSPEPRQYTTKARNAQEAHEAIRPAGTVMATREELGLEGYEGALYDLIWKRTVASQMAEARLKMVAATIEAAVDGAPASFRASGRTTEFPGFLRAYVEGSDDPDAALDDRDQPLPALAAGDKLAAAEVKPDRHETKPPARFTDASLVQLLEKEGIGRPSTYASILDTIVNRGYARRVGGQLAPSFTAFAVTQLLASAYGKFIDTQFTAGMEEVLDKIADGEMAYKPYLNEIWNVVENPEAAKEIDPIGISTIRHAKWGEWVVRVGRYGPYLTREVEGEKRYSLPEDLAPADLDDQEIVKITSGGGNERELGRDEATGLGIYLRKGPYGWYVQLGTDDEAPAKAPAKTKAKSKTAKTAKVVKAKPKRVSLLKDMSPETLTLEQALQLLTLPRKLGAHPASGKEVSANLGRFGPYVVHDGVFASLTKDDNLFSVDLARALQLFERKNDRAAGRSTLLRTVGEHPEDKAPIEILDGRYGPYVKHGKVNATIPKDRTPDSVTLDEAMGLLAARIAAGPPKKARGRAPTRRSGARRARQ